MTTPAPSHAEKSRTLAALASQATLATIARDPPGVPYASLVAVAFDDLGRALLCLSTLAEHTQNLLQDPRASLLVTEQGEGDPLERARVTLLGRCVAVGEGERDAARGRYLERVPQASVYVGFSDFAFYRLEPEQLRYIAGFGRMSWVDGQAYRDAAPDPIAPHVRDIVTHMNDDHADAVLAYATALSGIADATAARLLSVDRLGFDLSASTPDGPRRARLAFDEPVSTTDDVRRAMVALVRRARAKAP